MIILLIILGFIAIALIQHCLMPTIHPEIKSNASQRGGSEAAGGTTVYRRSEIRPEVSTGSEGRAEGDERQLRADD
jgi:hypothetical protein